MYLSILLWVFYTMNEHVGNFIGFARVHFWSSVCGVCKLKPHHIPCVCKFNNREIRHYLAWDYRAILFDPPLVSNTIGIGRG